MAIVKSGSGLGVSGTVGGITYTQQPDGRTSMSSKAQPSNIPPTSAQLQFREETKLISSLMKIWKDFVKMGWELQSKSEKMNQNNAMVKYLRANAFTGEGAQRHFDLSKVLVTRGNMPVPADVTLNISPYGFLFTWNTEIHSKKCHFTDQFVMMAYFPELEEVRYMTAGAQRHLGKDMLVLSGVEKGHLAEVYVAFVADNRKSISDSVHIGQITWE